MNTWKEQIEKIHQLRDEHAGGGGYDRIEKQHASGKLTAAERIDLLLDPGSFVETAPLMSTDPGACGIGTPRLFPGDGVLTGWGTIDGRTVCVAAEDFTVVGGTLGKTHAEKIVRLQRLAREKRVPLILLNDSGGARIEEGINALNGYGEIFSEHVKSSGLIPQICAILGPCSGGACYSPALCDFVFMVDGISKMFITGPAVVESVLGKRPSFEELGGARMHSKTSGCIHAMYNDEASCLMGIRKLLSYLPPHCGELPPHSSAGAGNSQAKEPEQPDWTQIVPDQTRKTYDMHQVLSHLTDEGSDLFEIQKHFAPNVITGFSYLDGRAIGIIANQPQWLGGSLDCDGSDKIARFIRFCDCFNIPLLTLVDVPAFLPGTDQEQQGIIRHGAKILYAYAQASVPKITLIVRKAFGGAYIAMNSKSLGADLVYSWPIAQIAVMGAEGAVGILYRRQISASEDPAAAALQLKDEYEEHFLNPDIAVSRGYIDDVLLPEETRKRLISSFAFLAQNTVPSMSKKHGNIPL